MSVITRMIRIPLRSYMEVGYDWQLEIHPGPRLTVTGRIYGRSGRKDLCAASLEDVEEAAEQIEKATAGDRAPATAHERTEVARILRAAMTPPPPPPPDWDPVAEIPF